MLNQEGIRSAVVLTHPKTIMTPTSFKLFAKTVIDREHSVF